MKPIYIIEFIGRYEKSDGTLSKRNSSFTVKDTCTDFKVGGTVIHKSRFFHIDEIKYTRI